MATTITKSIGATGRDYATLALWIAAIPADLVTADEKWVGELYNDAEFTAGGSIGAKTTDATRFIHLKCASGQSFRDHANKLTNALKYNQSNGVGIRTTTGYAGTILAVVPDYSLVEGIQMKDTANGNTTFALTGANSVVRDSIFYGATTNSTLNACLTLTSATAINCLAVHTASGAEAGIRGYSGADFYNCTVVQHDAVGGSNAGLRYDGYSAVPTVKNCAFFGFAALDVRGGGVGAPSYTTCATDLTGTTGVTGSLTYANQFEGISAAAEDFRLKSGNSLANVGTDLADPTVDIVGTARSTNWDVGAWEAAAAGATVVASLDAAIQRQNVLATASLDAAIQRQNTAIASLDAALSAAQTATAQLDAALSAGKTAAASLDAAVQAPKTATASLDAAVEAAKSLSATLDAALQASRSATASLDAYLIGAAGSAITVSLDAALQKAQTVAASLDAAIQRAGLTASASLDAALAKSQALVVLLDVAVARTSSADADLDAAVQIARTLSVGLDAKIGAFTISTKRTQIARAYDGVIVPRRGGRTNTVH